MATVNIMCPNFKCRSIMQIDEKKRGTKVRCAKCGQIVLVPSTSGKGKR